MAHYTSNNLMIVQWLLGALVVPWDIGADTHLRAMTRSGSQAAFFTLLMLSGYDIFELLSVFTYFHSFLPIYTFFFAHSSL